MRPPIATGRTGAGGHRGKPPLPGEVLRPTRRPECGDGRRTCRLHARRTTLTELSALARQFDTGVHIHAAEDACDDHEARQRFDTPLIDLLADAGVLSAASILAHGTHFEPAATPLLRRHGPTVAHCPRSNMNNAVGYAPVADFPCPILLGTDGIGSDMLTEAKCAWLRSRDAASTLAPQQVLEMLAGSARRASASLGVKLGRLGPGAAADVVVTDYVPATPLNADNLFGHLVFGMGPQFIRDVMIAGNWVVHERHIVTCDEADVRRRAREQASELCAAWNPCRNRYSASLW